MTQARYDKKIRRERKRKGWRRRRGRRRRTTTKSRKRRNVFARACGRGGWGGRIRGAGGGDIFRRGVG